ncbi:winged helix-turn-helix domain-containing protein [Propionibacteriaceae bacterium G1746]|uniref:winged helix-turn-helix domain-containing protein n=1 Tax=Aestuariimicrobium sp. G57 TaxID=3418485 RepID=UPI003C21D222
MPATPPILTIDQARRIALHAQGFGRPRPAADAPRREVTRRQVQQLITRLGQFQIDTINVVERAHYFPVYSRLGAYDKGLLDRALDTAPRRLFEYWGHAASLVDIELQPALRLKMARNPWPGGDRTLERHPGLDEHVLAELEARGPLTPRQIDHDEGERRREHWGWNWSAVKHVLEGLFTAGKVTVAGRNNAFERRYDLPDRVLPAHIIASPTPSPDDQVLALVRRAARALGVATLGCLTDYFRLKRAETTAALARLVASGELVPVVVEGWARPTWLWHEHLTASGQVRVPGPVRARALVSPFDSLIFERTRTLELFGFFYRIEIYVPEARRQHGYYVYPFLLGERFAARVDLKADRANGAIVVKAAWFEQGAAQPPSDVATALADELRELGRWTGCPRIVVHPRGDLSGELAAALVRDDVAAGPLPRSL